MILWWLAWPGERFWLVTKTICFGITWCLHARGIAAIPAVRWIEKVTRLLQGVLYFS